MSATPPPPVRDGYVIPPRYWMWLGRPRTIAVILWIATSICGVSLTYRALHWFDDQPTVPEDRRRSDGNSGHIQIDFGGQWLMGRMIATGNGHKLYDRQKQREILREGYPISDESPLQQEQAALPRHMQHNVKPGEDWQHDATNLMNWFMGGFNDPTVEWKKVGGAAAAPHAQGPIGNPLAALALHQAAADSITPEVIEKIEAPSIGGPLYPPVHAIFYTPLGMIDRPQQAYRAFQIICALLVPAAGLGIKLLTRGKIWWSVATLGLFLYPGMRGGLDLGQNPVLTLNIVLWGWVLASRGRNAAGGMVWGLLAFKPVWAAAFFLVPLLMKRWRFCIAMLGTGAAFGLLTLPFVGIDSWFHWLEIGKEASDLYKVNRNWIHLSRDLQGIPRRFLIDFNNPQGPVESALANQLAWTLWGIVLAATVILYLWRGNRARPLGISTAFLFLGAFLTCFHFMYYDVLISAMILAILFAEPRQFLRTKSFSLDPVAETPSLPAERSLSMRETPRQPYAARMRAYVNSFPLTILASIFFLENVLSGMRVEGTMGIRYFATTRADGEEWVPRIEADTGIYYPIDTLLLLVLWMWCGLQLLRKRNHEPAEASPAQTTSPEKD